MSCTKCGENIRYDDRHVSFVRHIETMKRGSILERLIGRGIVVTVHESKLLAQYHERCAP